MVLDTNVVLDWLVFQDFSVAYIVAAIEGGGVAFVTNQACIDELQRVLGYPEFKLDAAKQSALLARYLAAATIVEPKPGYGPPLPRCTDPDDQKFLELADEQRALLVTKDRALLRLARRVHKLERMRIVRPGDAASLFVPAASSASA